MGLRTPNQITIWLENQAGFDKYMKRYPKNPEYFLHFTTANDPLALEELEEGWDYLDSKIGGNDVEKEYDFALTKKVVGGVAGATYLYAEPQLQNDADLTIVMDSIIALAKDWAINNDSTVSEPQYNVGDKYLVLYIKFNP